MSDMVTRREELAFYRPLMEYLKKPVGEEMEHFQKKLRILTGKEAKPLLRGFFTWGEKCSADAVLESWKKEWMQILLREEDAIRDLKKQIEEARRLHLMPTLITPNGTTIRSLLTRREELLLHLRDVGDTVSRALLVQGMQREVLIEELEKRTAVVVEDFETLRKMKRELIRHLLSEQSELQQDYVTSCGM